jgi:YggT family protein
VRPAGGVPAVLSGAPMISPAGLVDGLIEFYTWVVIAAAIASWLVAFGVVNVRNQFVRMIVDFLYRITEPVLRPIRNVLPNLGGIDISPIILFLIIILIERVIIYYIYPNVI